MRLVLIYTIFFHLIGNSYAQNIDSLKSLLSSTTSIIEKNNLLITIADAYYNQKNIDALKYYINAYEFAQKNNIDSSIAHTASKIAILSINQNKIDSSYYYTNKAYTIWHSSNKDTKYIDFIIDIGISYNRVNIDSSLHYFKKANNLSAINNYLQGKANSLYRTGLWHRNQQNPDTALFYYTNAIELFFLLADTAEVCKLYTHLGNMFDAIGNLDKSILYHEKSLALSKAAKLHKEMGVSLFNLGNINKKTGILSKALDLYTEARAIFDIIKDEYGLASSLNALGLLYNEWHEYDKAINIFTEALIIETRRANNIGKIDLNINIGNAYVKLNEPDDAISSYLQALRFSREINDINKQVFALLHLSLIYTDLYNFELANLYINEINVLLPGVNQKHILATTYQGLCYSYSFQNKCKEALDAAEKSEEIALYINLDDLLYTIYLFKTQAYMCLGETKKALSYFKKYEQGRDLITKKQNDLRVKYETEQQEKEIQLLNQQQETSKKLIKAQRLAIYIFISGLVLIFIFLVLVINQYRQKKKANIKLAAQNDEITAQRDEIELQRDLLADQKQHIEEQKKEIEDSIIYAKRIQTAVLPDKELLDGILNKYFILFRPKDVVSGDFYWATKIDDWVIVTVSDCTGHGVPGAFMSMLGVSFLNEIVRNPNVNTAGKVLNELRTYVIQALKQQGIIGEQKDGMDISLCAINTKTYECHFAGANNPLYIFKKQSNELIEIKGDKMPVAIYEIMNHFTNNIIQLDTGDRVYLITDGFQDQFGGEKGKKFMSKHLKNLLIETSTLNIKEQENALNNALNKWVNYGDKIYSQVDDITMLGIEI